MVFLDPLPTIVNKIKANSRIIALLAPSRVHEGFMPDTPDIKGIYVTPLTGDLKPIVSTANQINLPYQGWLRWQVDSLSNESMEDANTLAKIACEAVMPSVVAAGIFTLSMQPRNVSYDKGYGCYRSTWRLESRCVEHLTG